MGSYDNEYKHYYRRVNNIKPEEREIKSDDYDEESLYYGARKNNNNVNIGISFLKGLIGTTICSALLLGSVLGGKYILGDKGITFYENVKLVIGKDDYYEDSIKELITKNIFQKNIQGAIKKEDSKSYEKVGEENTANVSDAKTVSSFKLDEKSVESTVLGDLKYKAIVPIKAYGSVEVSEKSMIFKNSEGEIFSVLDGEVIDVSDNKSGKMVEIDHGDGIISYYDNIGNIKVSKGHKIKKGEVIGNNPSKGDLILKIKSKESYLKVSDYIKI